jgi:recombination protein U
MLHDGEYLYLLELKSHKGKSLPLSAIRQSQVDDLLLAAKHRNIIAGLVVEFSDLGQVYFMPIDLVNNWYYNSERKSIPLQSFQNSPCIEIYGKKKKVNFRYNIEQFIIDAVGGYLCD